MSNHQEHTNLIWQIADLLRGPYRPPQYERVMLPMTVLRRFDCVLAPTKAKVLERYEKRKDGKISGDALDKLLNDAAGQRFHNHSPLTFEKLKGDPDNIEKHLVSYIKGFSANVRTIFDFFEFEAEIEKMREANILYLVVSKFCDVDLHPNSVPNDEMGSIFENLIRRFNELANETAGDHFTPREVIRLMVHVLFIYDDKLLTIPGTVRKLLDPACGTGGMLAEAQRYLRDHHHEAQLYAYGQDYNKRAFSEQIDTSTPTGKMIFTVLGAVAELERSLIAERVRAGLRNAKAKGRKLGRPAKQVNAAQIAALRAQGASWRAVGTRLGISAACALKAAQGRL